MPARLSDEEKRLRAMTLGQLADEAGHVKAERSVCAEAEDAIKAEMIRRGKPEAVGDLFRLQMTEPITTQRVDIKALRAAKGDKFLKPYLVDQHNDWKMNCYPLKRDPSRKKAS